MCRSFCSLCPSNNVIPHTADSEACSQNTPKINNAHFIGIFNLSIFKVWWDWLICQLWPGAGPEIYWWKSHVRNLPLNSIGGCGASCLSDGNGMALWHDDTLLYPSSHHTGSRCQPIGTNPPSFVVEAATHNFYVADSFTHFLPSPGPSTMTHLLWHPYKTVWTSMPSQDPLSGRARWKMSHFLQASIRCCANGKRNDHSSEVELFKSDPSRHVMQITILISLNNFFYSLKCPANWEIYVPCASSSLLVQCRNDGWIRSDFERKRVRKIDIYHLVVCELSIHRVSQTLSMSLSSTVRYVKCE